MKEFNNKNVATSLLMPLYLKRSTQFEIPITNGTALYSYIRKNGCTAVKNYARDTLQTSGPQIPETSFSFLYRNHRILTRSQLNKVQKRFFIYRDPLERAISLFKNKFIQGKENTEIQKNFESVTETSLDRCTFRFFVEQYLTRDWKDIDAHTRPQAHHILPIRYDLAIPLPRLQEGMCILIGEELSEKYFSQKVNNSSSNSQEYRGDLSDVPCFELRNYLKNKEMDFHNRSFLPDDLRKTLASIYEEDILFTRACGQSS